MQEGRISKDNADAITLCSIHGAKGLEWPIVFGVRFNEGECPLTDASTVSRVLTMALSNPSPPCRHAASPSQH